MNTTEFKRNLAVALLVVGTLAVSASLGSAQFSSDKDLLKKAEAGDSKAQLALGRAYEEGNGVTQNDALAVKWYRAAAEQGDAQAQNSLALMYRLGHGVEKDCAQTRLWYAKAARQNHGTALFNLGTMYYNGEGVTIDDSVAYAYFVLAQEAGSKEAEDAVRRMSSELPPVRLTEARLRAAELLKKGTQAPLDPVHAAKLYEQLAEAGNSKAQVRLAKMYLGGLGVTKDPAKTRAYCERAAKLGYSPAMVCMGFLYQSGELGDNPKPGFGWYERAAEKGNPIAMYSLGVMYANGQGVKQDNVKAYLWFLRSASGRVVLGVPAAEVIQRKLSPNQVERARREVRNVPIGILTQDSDMAEFTSAIKFQ